MPGTVRLRRDLHAIVRAGLDAVEPGRLVLRALERDDDMRRIRLLSAGKAAAAMAAAAAQILGPRIVDGLVVCPEALDIAAPLTTIAGGHPLPTVESERAGRRAIALAESVQSDERLLCLLSGGASALMAAPAAGISLDDKQETTGRLLRAGADPNQAQNGTAFTPLLIASAMVHTRFVDLMLDNGAKPDAVDWRGYTALSLVVRDSHYGLDLARKDQIVTIVKALLAHGANPNLRLKQPKAVTVIEVSLDGATPLLLAAEVNNTGAVKALLDAGADPHITTEYGTTALTLAAGAGTDEQRPRPPEERAMAIETAKLLVERGVDIHAVGQFGWTALHAAAYQGLTDVIEFLVSKGANINEMDAFGQTPLSISLAVLTQDIGARRPQIPRRYRKEVAEVILKLGATPLNKSGVVVVDQRNGDLELGREATQE